MSTIALVKIRCDYCGIEHTVKVEFRVSHQGEVLLPHVEALNNSCMIVGVIDSPPEAVQ